MVGAFEGVLDQLAVQIKNQKEKLVLRFYNIENIKRCGEKKLYGQTELFIHVLLAKMQRAKITSARNVYLREQPYRPWCCLNCP